MILLRSSRQACLFPDTHQGPSSVAPLLGFRAEPAGPVFELLKVVQDLFAVDDFPGIIGLARTSGICEWCAEIGLPVIVKSTLRLGAEERRSAAPRRH